MVTGQEATQLVLDGKLVANFNKNTSFFFFFFATKIIVHIIKRTVSLFTMVLVVDWLWPVEKSGPFRVVAVKWYWFKPMEPLCGCNDFHAGQLINWLFFFLFLFLFFFLVHVLLFNFAARTKSGLTAVHTKQ